MKNNWKKLMTFALALLLIAVLASGCKSDEQIALASQQGSAPVVIKEVPDERNLITVTGIGTVTAKPDSAEITFSVNTFAPTPEEAQQKNNEAMESVSAAIKAMGVAEEDMQSTGLNMYEEYDYSKEPYELKGYHVDNSLKVTVRNIDILGDLIAKAVEAGATTYYGLNYKISDTSESYTSALKSALQDAQRKAQALSEQAGAKLNLIPVSMTENYSENAPVMREMMAAGADKAEDGGMSTVPVSTGTVEVKANITVIYEITAE